MKKRLLDMRVVRSEHIHAIYALIVLTPKNDSALPEIVPGQFVQVEISGCKNTFLRRPISVNFVDYKENTLWLLVREAGYGTHWLANVKRDDILNVLLPLGNGFTVTDGNKTSLLVGGGVGVAPLLYLGKVLCDNGSHPKFLLGARSANDVLQFDEFNKYGEVYVATEDGSLGEKGLVTEHSVLSDHVSHIACCGPSPMMKAVARIARDRNIDCEVSLENMMACGIGACLCCVEKTIRGNVCVCTEGPVFNVNQLTW